jgi:hypothetical protein
MVYEMSVYLLFNRLKWLLADKFYRILKEVHKL